MSQDFNSVADLAINSAGQNIAPPINSKGWKYEPPQALVNRGIDIDSSGWKYESPAKEISPIKATPKPSTFQSVVDQLASQWQQHINEPLGNAAQVAASPITGYQRTPAVDAQGAPTGMDIISDKYRQGLDVGTNIGPMGTGGLTGGNVEALGETVARKITQEIARSPIAQSLIRPGRAPAIEERAATVDSYLASKKTPLNNRAQQISNDILTSVNHPTIPEPKPEIPLTPQHILPVSTPAGPYTEKVLAAPFRTLGELVPDPLKRVELAAENPGDILGAALGRRMEGIVGKVVGPGRART